jgi:hypothetical protein
MPDGVESTLHDFFVVWQRFLRHGVHCVGVRLSPGCGQQAVAGCRQHITTLASISGLSR